MRQIFIITLLYLMSISALAQQKPMPDFDFEQVIRSKRPVVVNFWATYCKPCIQEFPDLTRLQEKYGKQILVLGVNVQNANDEGMVRNFVDRSEIEYPVVFNAPHIFRKYQGQTIPLTLIFDGKGNVVARQQGMRADFAGWLSQEVNKLLPSLSGSQRRWRQRRHISRY